MLHKTQRFFILQQAILLAVPGFFAMLFLFPIAFSLYLYEQKPQHTQVIFLTKKILRSQELF